MSVNEKIVYKMVKDRRPITALFADKLAVRDYVASRVGEEVLVGLQDVYSVVPSSWDQLPAQGVLKPSHGSGAVILLSRAPPQEDQLPAMEEWQVRRWFGRPWRNWAGWVNPDTVDQQRLSSLCQHWLDTRYARTQWAYQDLPRRLVIEELLLDGSHPPKDYKFFVAYGEVLMVQVDLDRVVDHRQVLFAPQWTRIDCNWKYPGPDLGQPLPDPPMQLETMLEIASTLGGETDFVRVDLYAVGDFVRFGELTNYPFGGTEAISPEHLGVSLFESWRPPKRYR